MDESAATRSVLRFSPAARASSTRASEAASLKSASWRWPSSERRTCSSARRSAASRCRSGLRSRSAGEPGRGAGRGGPGIRFRSRRSPPVDRNRNPRRGRCMGAPLRHVAPGAPSSMSPLMRRSSSGRTYPNERSRSPSAACAFWCARRSVQRSATSMTRRQRGDSGALFCVEAYVEAHVEGTARQKGPPDAAARSISPCASMSIDRVQGRSTPAAFTIPSARPPGGSAAASRRRRCRGRRCP
jgi:hypothetical protein